MPSRRTRAGRPAILLYTRFFEFDLDRLWRIMHGVRAQRPEVRFLVVGKGFAGEETLLLRMAQDAGWRVRESGLRADGAPRSAVPGGSAIRPPREAGAGPLPASSGVADRVPSASADWDLAYAGWGTPDNLPACFSTADLAIYPFDDTLLNRTKCPVKLLDLLGAGVPVVADAVGQIPEMIVDGRTGALVPPGDDAAFVRAVLALLADPDRLAQMRTQAAPDVAARFAWSDLALVAEKAYMRAISA